jgi:hypothetical protein
VGFGWWSHDIGGHMSGITDAELYTRWVQLGVFSPVMRLHSTKDPFLERRPWGYNDDVLRVTRNAMQLRHALIPYLYSMAWRDHKLGIPLVRPMYHLWPDLEQAYSCPNQYGFGSELIAAPFITPIDPDTRLSRQVVWLPKGTWFEFSGSNCIPVGSDNGEWHAIYGGLDDVPVFAKAGAIVPLGPKVGWGGIHNPDQLLIHIYPGENNEFELYEDDGVSQNYSKGAYALTRFSQDKHLSPSGINLSFRIDAPEGDVSVLPPEREYQLLFFAIQKPRTILTSKNGSQISPSWSYDAEKNVFSVKVTLTPRDSFEVCIEQVEIMREQNLEKKYYRLISAFRVGNQVKNSLISMRQAILAEPDKLAAFQVVLTRSQMRAFIESFYGSGLEHIKNTGEEKIVIWNNDNRPDFSWLLSKEYLFWGPGEKYHCEKGILPNFHVIHPDKEFKITRWNRTRALPALLQVDFSQLLKVVITFNANPTYPVPKEGML